MPDSHPHAKRFKPDPNLRFQEQQQQHQQRLHMQQGQLQAQLSPTSASTPPNQQQYVMQQG